MRPHHPLAIGLALAVSAGSFQGCGFGMAPTPLSQAQVLKADAKTQKSMRDYYQSLKGKGKGRPRAR
ncbi:hypothetical protein ACYOEI_10690 [Singulisphaera rosea]